MKNENKGSLSKKKEGNREIYQTRVENATEAAKTGKNGQIANLFSLGKKK